MKRPTRDELESWLVDLAEKALECCSHGYECECEEGDDRDWLGYHHQAEWILWRLGRRDESPEARLSARQERLDADRAERERVEALREAPHVERPYHGSLVMTLDQINEDVFDASVDFVEFLRKGRS